MFREQLERRFLPTLLGMLGLIIAEAPCGCAAAPEQPSTVRPPETTPAINRDAAIGIARADAAAILGPVAEDAVEATCVGPYWLVEVSSPAGRGHYAISSQSGWIRERSFRF